MHKKSRHRTNCGKEGGREGCIKKFSTGQTVGGEGGREGGMTRKCTVETVDTTDTVSTEI